MTDRRALPSPILYSGTVHNDILEIPFGLRVTISVTTPNSAIIYFGDDEMGVLIDNSIGYILADVIWQKVMTIRVDGSAIVVVEEGRV